LGQESVLHPIKELGLGAYLLFELLFELIDVVLLEGLPAHILDVELPQLPVREQRGALLLEEMERLVLHQADKVLLGHLIDRSRHCGDGGVVEFGLHGEVLAVHLAGHHVDLGLVQDGKGEPEGLVDRNIRTLHTVVDRLL